MAEESGHCCPGELNQKPEQKFDPASHLSGVNSTPVCLAAFLYAWFSEWLHLVTLLRAMVQGVGEDTKAQFCGKPTVGSSGTPGASSTG